MNALLVKVASKNCNNAREFKGKWYGEQDVALLNGSDFPMPFKVNVEQGHEYEAGDYIIDPRSYTTDEHRNLKLKSMKLLPIGGIAKK